MTKQPLFPQPTTPTELVDYLNAFLSLKEIDAHLRAVVLRALNEIAEAGK